MSISSKSKGQSQACQFPGCGEPEDHYLHLPSSECEGCQCPRDHHEYAPDGWPAPIAKPAPAPRTTAKQRAKQERDTAREELRAIVKPGDTVYCVLRHVSRSGMQRVIDLQVMTQDADGRPWLRTIGGLAAKAMGDRYDRDRGGVVVGGCGMDMGFHLVYSLGYVLWPKGFGCVGERCRSNDHSNGDRDYTPHGTTRRMPVPPTKGAAKVYQLTCEHWHRDGGYALKHEWV